MAVPFAYPPRNMTSIFDLINYVNAATAEGGHGLLGIMFLILVGSIAFLATRTQGAVQAAGFTTFLVMISSILLRFMGLINDSVMYICIIAFVGTLIWLLLRREQEK